MQVERIDRVVLAVNDIKESARLFQNILGTKFDEYVEAKDLSIRVVYSSLGLQLNEATAPGSDVRKFIDRHGEGPYCLVLKVKDIAEARDEMKSKGMREVYYFQEGDLKEAIFHPKQTFGVMIVLCEYPDYHGATVAALRRQPQRLL